jgi:hypothetical protein
LSPRLSYGRLKLAPSANPSIEITMMRFRTLSAAAVLSALLVSPAAQAKQEPYEGKVPGWKFTIEMESSGYVNCRAITSSGGLDAIAAQRNDGHAYFSIAAQGLRGKFPKSQVIANGITWTVNAEANGSRLWFPDIPVAGMEMIMASGMYEFVLSNGQRNSVDLTNRGAAAWAVVRNCVKSVFGK